MHRKHIYPFVIGTLVVAVLVGHSGIARTAPSPANLEFRTIDGSGNNDQNPTWGAAHAKLVRAVVCAYDDEIDEPSGADRPSARLVSNVMAAQPVTTPSASGPSNMFWLWGQFLDHDLDLTDALFDEFGICLEPFPIPVPAGDPFFDPLAEGDREIDLCRSIFDPTTGTDPSNPREQVNAITAYIDASNVYGSDVIRGGVLRALDGTGKLLVTDDALLGDLLPYNVFGMGNASLPGQDPTSLFLAGDVRANENVALTAMHTLWVREHNTWAQKLANRFPSSTPDEIYETARVIVGAEIQSITFREFLPVLLGPTAIPPYGGYDDTTDAGIANVFSTVAYRFGHSMLTNELFRLDSELNPTPEGPIALAAAFFAPDAFVNGGGVEPLLRGAVRQRANDLDPFVVDAVRNFLFGPPGAGGFDLASLNIQRGRDHGHPSYNDVRAAFGLAPKPDLASISDDPEVQARLAATYADVDQVDPWVGGLSEPAVNGGLLGETFSAIVRDQFLRLRDGDRFWYQNHLPPRIVNKLQRQTLTKVIRRNTDIGGEIQANAFLVP